MLPFLPTTLRYLPFLPTIWRCLFYHDKGTEVRYRGQILTHPSRSMQELPMELPVDPSMNRKELARGQRVRNVRRRFLRKDGRAMSATRRYLVPTDLVHPGGLVTARPIVDGMTLPTTFADDAHPSYLRNGFERSIWKLQQTLDCMVEDGHAHVLFTKEAATLDEQASRADMIEGNDDDDSFYTKMEGYERGKVTVYEVPATSGLRARPRKEQHIDPIGAKQGMRQRTACHARKLLQRQHANGIFSRTTHNARLRFEQAADFLEKHDLPSPALSADRQCRIKLASRSGRGQRQGRSRFVGWAAQRFDDDSEYLELDLGHEFVITHLCSLGEAIPTRLCYEDGTLVSQKKRNRANPVFRTYWRDDPEIAKLGTVKKFELSFRQKGGRRWISAGFFKGGHATSVHVNDLSMVATNNDASRGKGGKPAKAAGLQAQYLRIRPLGHKHGGFDHRKIIRVALHGHKAKSGAEERQNTVECDTRPVIKYLLHSGTEDNFDGYRYCDRRSRRRQVAQEHRAVREDLRSMRLVRYAF